jgi:hypothetical protein
MGPEGSLPHSQKLSTCPYPEPDGSIPPSYLSKIHFDIRPPMSWSCQWFFPSGFPTINLHVFLFSPFLIHALMMMMMIMIIIIIILGD